MIEALATLAIAFAYTFVGGVVYQLLRVTWPDGDAAPAAIAWPLTLVGYIAYLVFQIVAVLGPRAVVTAVRRRKQRIPRARVHRT